MLLNKTNCLCGKDLKQEQFTNYVPNKDLEFYGGRVAMIGIYNCECGRQLKVYFERDDYCNLNLIDLEVIAELKIEENEGTKYIVEETKNDIKETSCVDKVDLKSLSYKELQDLAKANGISKVNVSRDILTNQIETFVDLRIKSQ